MCCKTIFFFVNDTILPADNNPCFRCIVLERILKVITTTDEKILAEKLQCDINRAAAKISALSRIKIDE